jgi:uncharacterized protein (DUF3820 family)
MNEDVIRRRAAARGLACDVFSLIVEEASNIQPDAIDSFWDEIRKSLPQQATVTIMKAREMTVEEAHRFGMSLMPFGEFKGQPVNTIPLDRLEWYSDSKFQQELIRYLNSPNIKRERMLNDLSDLESRKA